MKNLFLDGMPTYGIILIVIAALVAVIILILVFVPHFRTKFSGKKSSDEDIAEEEVKEIVVTEKPDETKAAREDRLEKNLRLIERREKELGFIFSEDDLVGMLLEIEQDAKDDGKR
jgi:uncharacterized membrane protein